MSDRETCIYIVLITINDAKTSDLTFVLRAECPMHAYNQAAAILVRNGIFEPWNIAYRAIPIGPESFRDVVDDPKEIARTYWLKSRASIDSDLTDETAFEEAWQECGPMPTKAAAE